MAKLSLAAFVAFLAARVAAKDGYIMGATGQAPTKWSPTSWWFTQYSGSQKTKALYWRTHAQRVWDCNGLAEGYVKDMTGKDVNTKARYNYANWCGVKGAGKIPVNRRVPGAAVFMGASAAKIHHVGYLEKPVVVGNPAGDWYVIEARGVMYGVVRTRMNARAWNFWGWMDKHFDYAAPAVAPEGDLHVTGDGVNLRTGPGTQYESVGKVSGGDRLVSLEAEGWQPILKNGQILWICAKYVEEA